MGRMQEAERERDVKGVRRIHFAVCFWPSDSFRHTLGRTSGT